MPTFYYGDDTLGGSPVGSIGDPFADIDDAISGSSHGDTLLVTDAGSTAPTNLHSLSDGRILGSATFRTGILTANRTLRRYYALKEI